MSDSYSDIPSEGEWEDGGEGDLAWNEFDWEIYLRAQDAEVERYLALYDSLSGVPNRIDEAAIRMGWEMGVPDAAEAAGPAAVASPLPGEEPAPPEDAPPASAAEPDGDEVYTFYRNPVFIASRALFLGLRRSWTASAADPALVAPRLAMAYLESLHRGESLVGMAVHSLEFGDYAMAIALFKRGMAALNESLGLLSSGGLERSPTVLAYRDGARRRLFDLREIWLRVIEECRMELSRPIDDES